MLVSVIIPNYNGSRWLEQTVESCLVQGDDYLKEIIIVDDHSQDNSWAILSEFQKRYPGIVRVLKNPKSGANAARNYGFEQATGKYIQWLDADDQLLAGKWAAQVAALQADPSLDMVVSDWYLDVYEGDIRSDRLEKTRYPMPDFLAEILRDNWSVPAGYLLTRSLADRLQLQKAWNEKRLINQDREYFTRAGLLGAKVGYVPGFFSVYNVWSSASIRHRYIDRKYHSIADVLLSARKDILADRKMLAYRRAEYLQIIHAQLLDVIYFQRDVKLPFTIFFRQVDWRRGGKAKLRWGLYTRYRLLRAWIWHRFGL